MTSYLVILRNLFTQRKAESIVATDSWVSTPNEIKSYLGKCKNKCSGFSNDLCSFSNYSEKFCHQKCNAMESIDKRTSLKVDQEIQWTREEKLLFWNVMKAHISFLLSKTYEFDEKYKILFAQLKPMSYVDFQKCRLKIRQYLWKGRYRKGIALYQYMRHYFNVFCDDSSDLSKNLGEVEQIFLSPYIAMQDRNTHK